MPPERSCALGFGVPVAKSVPNDDRLPSKVADLIVRGGDRRSRRFAEGGPCLGWHSGLINRLRDRLAPDGFDPPALRLFLQRPLSRAYGNAARPQ